MISVAVIVLRLCRIVFFVITTEFQSTTLQLGKASSSMIVFSCIGFFLSGRVLSVNKTLPEPVPDALSLSGYAPLFSAFKLIHEESKKNRGVE